LENTLKDAQEELRRMQEEWQKKYTAREEGLIKERDLLAEAVRELQAKTVAQALEKEKPPPPAGEAVHVEDLIFGLAHQIRTPLAVMQSFAETFVAQRWMRKSRREAFQALLRSIETIQHRIDVLTEFSHPIQLNKRPVNLNALMEKTLLLVQDKCRDQEIRVKIRPLADLAELSLDPDQLRTAFLHVLFNSVEAMPHGGELEVEIQRDLAQGPAVRVKDTGMGIAPEKMSEVLRPFYSTKPGSMGIGLAVVRKILNAHGGGLQLTSEPGKGTEALCRFREIP
jgi:signal transduction histidine kinase